MKRSLFLAIIIVLGMVSLCAGEEADPGRPCAPALTYQPGLSNVLNYQGVLTDAGGTAVPDGSYQITFRLYNVLSGGSDIWEETHANVQVTKGIFNVMLGSVMALNLPFDFHYYLGISVEGEPELTPRIPLTAAAYAFIAKGTRGDMNLFPSSGYVGINTISPGYPLDIVGTSDIQVGLRYTGYNSQYTSIYVNAASPTSRPAIGYMRGTLRAMTLFDTDDHFRIRIDGSSHFSLSPYGYLGIGVALPAERLDIDGAIRIGTTSFDNAGTIRWTGSDFEGYNGSSWQSLTGGGSGSLPPGVSGQTLRHDGADWTATSNLYNDGISIGIGTTAPTATLNVGGSVNIGTDTHSGSLEIYRSGVADQMFEVRTSSAGGDLYLYDEAISTTAALEHDGNGEGGYFYVKRDPTYTAFRVDGNYNGTGSPLVSIFGGSTSASFNMGVAGNTSVQLPASSVSSSEIENEAGVASFEEGTAGVYLDSSPTITVIASQSITVPTSGYVLAIATCQARIDHDFVGDAMSANFGVSSNLSVFPVNQDVTLALGADLPTGLYDFPVTCSGLFEVSAGTRNFYFLGTETDGSYMAYDRQLSLVFIPTAYGTVEPTVTGAGEDFIGEPMTEAELAAQRAASIEANVARMERELAELRAQFEALNLSEQEEE